jgi:DNA (cytosine-5)-methyltransferase 1
MGLQTGCVTDASELTQNQQITALGNDVQPLQSALALTALLVA